MATLRPPSAQRPAAVSPAGPAPITTTSNISIPGFAMAALSWQRLGRYALPWLVHAGVQVPRRPRAGALHWQRVDPGRVGGGGHRRTVPAGGARLPSPPCRPLVRRLAVGGRARRPDRREPPQGGGVARPAGSPRRALRGGDAGAGRDRSVAVARPGRRRAAPRRERCARRTARCRDGTRAA